ncbi:carbohydrate kinase family protein [Flavitalea flava]
MKKTDVIVVGELNVDFILNQIGSFPSIGKEVLARQMTLTLGSSSAIFASNLSSLGTNVAFTGKIGKDIFGDLVLLSLQRKGVNTDNIIQSEAFNTGATVVLNFDEDRAMITHPGAMDHLTPEDINQEQWHQARHLHFSSYFLQPGLKPHTAALFQAAKKAGLTTSFDTQWDPLETWEMDFEHILPFVDVFLPNENELLFLTGKKTLEAALDRVKDYAHTIVVKLGNQGSLAVHNGKTIHKPAFLNDRVVDAIGAGDSFNAGFIHQFIRDAPLETCQEFGNLIGALSTTEAGGTAAFTNLKTTLKNAKERFGYPQEQPEP